MSTPPSLKLPVVCFIILSLTLFFGGLGTLGAVVILFNHFPAGAPIYIIPLLALNGLLCWILTVFCGMSAWKLFKQRPKMKAFCGLAWVLMAGFILWNVLVEFLLGWSTGGVVMIVIWSVLEALIFQHAKTRGTDPI